MYVCHSAGTTSTAIFLRRDDTKLIAIGMCLYSLYLCAASRASTFITQFISNLMLGARHVIHSTKRKLVRQALVVQNHYLPIYFKISVIVSQGRTQVELTTTLIRPLPSMPRVDAETATPRSCHTYHKTRSESPARS